MSLNQGPSLQASNRARTAFQVSTVSMLAFLIVATQYAYFAARNPGWQIVTLAGITIVVALLSAYSMYECRRDRVDIGVGIMVSAVMIDLPVSSALLKGLGVFLGVAQLVAVSVVIVLLLSRSRRTLWIALNLVSSLLTVLLDLLGSGNRVELPGVQSFVPAVVGILLAVLIFLLIRDFRNFTLRAKIIVGILATGGIALGILAFLAVNRGSQVIASISARLETSVSLLAEEQLVNKVFTEAAQADQFFQDVTRASHQLASYRASLQSQESALDQGTYWDARTRLRPLDGGKYGNASTDVSSVFVPSGVSLEDAVIRELNTSAYLDFSAPQLLQENPSLLAIYYIDTHKTVRYYPNIELATLLPPDFDGTKRPYYELAAPASNPDRRTVWTTPYVDAAVGGLVVTAGEPVYLGNTFKGVVAADVKLTTITQRTAAIKVGQTGYAFMLDESGRIISMPPAGYGLFGLDPKAILSDTFLDKSMLGQGFPQLDAVVQKMVAGGSGLDTIRVGSVDTYITYAHLPSVGYSLAIVVPVSEMQTAIQVARNETRLLTQSAIRTAALILIATLIGAILVSLSLGQVIAAPVRRLTEVAERITGGDLTQQAQVETRDEIGTLAQAFNAMTSRLRETLLGLEQKVDERTAELNASNRRNENRARQFEAIALVSRAISSTRDLDGLLSQITSVISREFGFYHVGIFLLDTAREYAVLSAANSEGGQRMLARGHRLKVGQTGMVGYVTSTGRPRLALDTGADAVFFNNPDLPGTRSAVTLPLRSGMDIIGALDVQSMEPNAFNQEDVEVLTVLADQVSIAIQNARQFEQTQKALSESEALSRQFVQSGWRQFTRGQNIIGIRHTGAKATLLYRRNRKEKQAGENSSSREQAQTKQRGASLSLPVKLRGEVIGSVDVRSSANRQFDQDELDIVTAILERAAIAMENARLLAESQKRAAKERAIGEISAKISAQTNLDELIKTAAQELNRSLPGREIAIQLKNDQEGGDA